MYSRSKKGHHQKYTQFLRRHNSDNDCFHHPPQATTYKALRPTDCHLSDKSTARPPAKKFTGRHISMKERVCRFLSQRFAGSHWLCVRMLSDKMPLIHRPVLSLFGQKGRRGPATSGPGCSWPPSVQGSSGRQN